MENYPDTDLQQETQVEQQPEETLQQETQPETQEQPQQKQATQQESEKEYNIRRLREERELYRQERDELARKLMLQEQQQQKSEPVDEDISLGDNDLVEGKHFAKIGRRVKKVEEENRAYVKQLQTLMVENKVRTERPDFDKVVTPDAIDALKKQYPAIARTIATSQDEYSQYVSLYDVIKNLGIYNQEINPQEKAAIERNAMKPKPATSGASYGDTPLSQANAFITGELTDEYKAMRYREMMKYSQE